MELEEYAKVCDIIHCCNDMIAGKFILAYNKIANILRKISESDEVYSLMAGQLNNFDFEREFSRAQLRTANGKHQFVLPNEDNKILPFVFCLLLYINNKTIDFDAFVKKYFSAGENYGVAFLNFVSAIIVPFRDALAKTFNIPFEKDEKGEENMKQNFEEEQEDFEEESNQEEYAGEYADEEECADENEDVCECDEDDEEITQSYPELTAEKVEQFLMEIQANCGQILTELPYEKKVKEDLKDDIEYISNAIISNCENQDLVNAIALITALDYIVQKTKNIKFYTREMKNLIVALYEGDE